MIVMMMILHEGAGENDDSLPSRPQCVEVDFDDDVSKSDAHCVETAALDVLDFTLVTPTTSFDLTPLPPSFSSSGRSEEATSPDPQIPGRDSAGGQPEQDLDGVEGLNVLESSYSGVYSRYSGDAAAEESPGGELDLDVGDHRAQSAATALGTVGDLRRRGGGRLSYADSFLNRTPSDVDVLDIGFNRRHGTHRRRMQRQQPYQLSLLFHQPPGGGDDVDIAATARRRRQRPSIYHENLI